MTDEQYNRPILSADFNGQQKKSADFCTTHNRQIGWFYVLILSAINSAVKLGSSFASRCYQSSVTTSRSLSVYFCWVRVLVLGMWRSSHLNSTMFHVPIIDFEPQVYTIADRLHMFTPTGHRNNQLNKCALLNSLKGLKIILDMADRHVSKDGPFRILGSALTFGLLWYHFFIFFINTC